MTTGDAVTEVQPLDTCHPISFSDWTRIREVTAFVNGHDSTQALAEMLPDLPPGDRAAVTKHCRFSHAAVLIYSCHPADARRELADSGLRIGPMTPSSVVRERLARRYKLPAEHIEIGILRAPVGVDSDSVQREIEIFLVANPPGGDLARVAVKERDAQAESHIAFEVYSPDEVIVRGLHTIFTTRGGMECDGGGYNPYEDATVLYFRHAGPTRLRLGRLELSVRGHFAEVLRSHWERSPAPPDNTPPDGADAASPTGRTDLLAGATTPSVPGSRTPVLLAEQDPAVSLLRLMTGAWTTQAIAAAAELSLADHIAARGSATSGRLAQLTGSDPHSLDRLLRYLASLGILRRAHGVVELTEAGHLLRTDVEHSLHALARIYGGLFYQSFGELLYSVRTGRPGFDHLFGTNHFDYFAQHPGPARLFDQAMASSSAIFAAVADLVDFSTASVVVDVGGGNGELLGRILRKAPRLRGVLFERDHVLESAHRRLAELDVAGRCELVAGDLTCAVPSGGDVYILSRILHDWDDARCLSILRACAAASADAGTLLIIERLLPEDDRESLATAWDIHMMCNVGGRERTGSHYRMLLNESGFEHCEDQRLSLECSLLRARRRA